MGTAPQYNYPHTREAMTCGPMFMAAGGRTELLANPTRLHLEVPT
jgi:hypothetical protein